MLDEYEIVLKELNVLSLLCSEGKVNFKGLIVSREYKEVYFLYADYECSLDHYLLSKGELDKALITSEILKLLVFLHSNGIVQGNINCKQIWLTSCCHPSFLSFTNCYIVETPAFFYIDTFKTPTFIPPELSLFKPNFGTFQDIWAFGCVLIEIFIDYSKYSPDTIIMLKNDVFHYSMPPKIPLDITENLAKIIANCLRIDAKKRPDIVQLIQKINQFFKDEDHLKKIELTTEMTGSLALSRNNTCE